MLSHAFLRSNQFKYLGALYLHSLIRLLAVSMFQFFNGIYLYEILIELGLSVPQTLAIISLFFSIMFLTQALAIAPCVWLIAKKGLRFSVFWGSIFLIAFYLILYFARFDPIFLFIAAVLGGVQIGLYWTAYHIYFSELTDDKRQGEEISIGAVLGSIVLIAGPAFGGLIITYGGYNSVFLAMVVLVLFSLFPLKYLPRRKDVVEINILKIVASLNPRSQIKSYLALAGLGGSDIVYTVFWPIYIFPILAGFAGVGFMGALAAFVTSITTIGLGVIIDKFGAKKLVNFMSPLDSILWLVKAIAVTANQIYIVSGLQAITTAGQTMSLDSLVYERARHKDLVSFIVQREIGLSVGKFIFLFVIGILFWFNMPLVGVLIAAAIVALFPRFYPETKLDN